jgi:hypothetical protein
MRDKQNIACASKNTKVVIASRSTIKYFTMALIGQLG